MLKTWVFHQHICKPCTIMTTSTANPDVTHICLCVHTCLRVHQCTHPSIQTHKHKHSVWLVVISCFKSCSSQILSLQTVCLYLQTDLQICKCALCSDKTAIAAAKIGGGLAVTKLSMQWQNCPFFLAVVNLQLQKQHVASKQFCYFASANSLKKGGSLLSLHS